LSDRDFDVVPDDEAASSMSATWRALALTANSRVGLLHDILSGLAAEAPGFELAGMTEAPLYGQTVIFMVGRDRSESDEAPLRSALPRRVRPSDRLMVAVDQRLTARGLDGPVREDRLLLQLGVRTPDRPGVLRDTLRALTTVLAEYAPPGVAVADSLDVWFVQLRVVNGRTTRGRITLRLPGSSRTWRHWQTIDWPAVQRSVTRVAALAARPAGNDLRAGGGWFPADFDDTVITTELLRTQAAAAIGSSADDFSLPILQAEPKAE
jgi:hypothetical protein